MKGKKLLLTAAVAAVCAGGNVQTAEAVVYELNPIVVTATRYDKADLEVPATTQIVSAEQLETTGAVNAEEALRYTTGVIYKASTAGMGGGEFLIRGKRRGTLVMVDGVSINFRNSYANLDNIPIDDIERVEIIRGGGAVMYGSDAIGGVVNIITKKKKDNSVTLSAGNFGRQSHGFQVGNDKVHLGFLYDKRGEILNTSQPSTTKNKYDSKFFHFHGGEKYVGTLNFNINENLHLRTMYADHNYSRSYNYANKPAPARYDDRETDHRELQAALQYNKEGLSATLSFHRQMSRTMYDYYNYAAKESAEFLGKLDRQYHYEYTDKMLSFDIHNEWEHRHGVVIAGASIDHNSYDFYANNKPKWDRRSGQFVGYNPETINDYSRNVYSLYASYEHDFNEEHMMTLSGRQTWTGNSPGEKEFHEFTPQVQYLYRPSEDLSFFASYGESFTLPTMNDLYGKGYDAGNVGLKPETGKHYEVGAKYRHDNALWKISVFDSDVKNFMRVKKDQVTGEDIAVNEDTKNKGVEISVDLQHNEHFSSNWGLVVQNPKFYDARYPEDGWQRDYGRLQMNGGLRYKKDKWSVAFNASYLGRRVLSSYQEEVRPLLMTSLQVSYRPTENYEIFFDADNLFDREDITSHVSSRYNAQPFNFILGAKYQF